MQARTYKEAVEIMVRWWSEKSFKTPMNQNNGDDSPNGGIAFLLMNRAATIAQANVSEEQIQKFESKLTEILLLAEGKGYHATMLDVDYDPNRPLQEACNHAGISTRTLPVKTFTRINEKNKVEGRYQYGGDWFIL